MRFIYVFLFVYFYFFPFPSVQCDRTQIGYVHVVYASFFPLDGIFTPAYAFVSVWVVVVTIILTLLSLQFCRNPDFISVTRLCRFFCGATAL